MEEPNSIPNLTSSLRHILRVPSACYEASGIVVNGRRIKSLVFTTDIAIIRNCDADAVFAVYPFTPQQAISDAIIRSSYIPVFCGCGGGTTRGLRIVTVTKRETDVISRMNAGAAILNIAGGSRTPEIVRLVRETVPHVPIIATGGPTNETIRATIAAGANAVTYTPPSAKVMFSEIMDNYREEQDL